MDDETTRIARQFIESIPHCKHLNIELVRVDHGLAELLLPHDDRLIGDPETGVIHGGAVFTLLDTCSGAAVASHPDASVNTATMDLRIDYMRAAAPGRPSLPMPSVTTSPATLPLCAPGPAMTTEASQWQPPPAPSP